MEELVTRPHQNMATDMLTMYLKEYLDKCARHQKEIDYFTRQATKINRVLYWRQYDEARTNSET